MEKKLAKAHQQLPARASAISRAKSEQGVLQDQLVELTKHLALKDQEVGQRQAV